jgi:hypothetical protein
MPNHTSADFSRHSYNKDNDMHVQAIDKLVHELGIPAEEVNRSYREVLDELKKDIKVKTILPVLASMGAKQRLLKER